ncbi:type II secretory protein PulC [Sphingomonas sp. Leaf412]|uniref:type II secretion system protein N n=1 Tax=Sphingomonas sp. Leaf412 TaxID=1736370 RepID=UPI0006FF69D5|nr:type II secretion system protein N [Sphingomonas sp. Leaf412]KQT32738.1 type II secretory protein PulC [Sphingomonas sp. Leaf412]
MRLKFDARARAILRRLPVVNVYSALELALLAGLAAQGARLLWTIVTPVAPLGAWVPTGPALPADPAGVIAGFDPFYRVSGAATAQGPAAVTSLRLTLFGTRIDAARGGGSAIVAGPDGMQRSISVGEEVAPGVILKSVAFDHVTLDRGGAAEDLFLDQSGGAPATPETPPASGAPLTAGGPAVGGGGAIPVDLLRGDITAIPRIDGGRISGLTVRGQGGSAFADAGLRDGDVVTAIGGRPIAGPADLDRLAREGAAAGTLALTIERGGQSLPLTIPVTK